jgi:peptide/nickel transport system ATP-binding protein
MTPVLEIDRLTVNYQSTAAVRGVSLQLEQGEVLGLVGESGSGKTTLGMAILGLLPAGTQVTGAIRFQGQDLTKLAQRRLRALRGEKIALIMQNPASALDPAHTIGRQFVELFRAHGRPSRAEALAAAESWLDRVGIPDPKGRLRAFPHQLSGGMNQRVMIALALALDPTLLIADEPTSALDVTVQAQILTILRALIETFDGASVVVSHDLGVIAQLATRVAVMYRGDIVEEAPVQEIFSAPRDDYTKHLLASLPARREHRATPAESAGTVVVPGNRKRNS